MRYSGTIQTKWIRIALAAMMAAALLIFSAANVFAAKTSVSISDYTVPDVIGHGHGFDVRGIIKAKGCKIKKIEIGVQSKSGKWTSVKYTKRGINSSKFNLKKLDTKLKFRKLSAGNYYYRIYVTTDKGKKKRLIGRYFTVLKKDEPAAFNCNYPKTIKKGSSFGLKGMIKSPSIIKSVTAGVMSTATGKWTSVKYYRRSLNSKTFDMRVADPHITFGKLGAGTFRYVIVIKNQKGTYTVLDKTFTVKETATQANPSGGDSDQAGSSDDSGQTDTGDQDKSDDDSGSNNGTAKIKITNLNKPGTRSVGKAFKLRGTIKSNQVINKVEIGIVYEPTNKWTAYKYTNSKVNAKTFDISLAASKVRVDRLAAGTFAYRIYVHTDTGVYVALNKKFKVNPSSKPMKAVKWARKIANNDEFSYGKKPKTSKVGCYFCGTNQKRKPKGYEKTYVCMTFVHAAYAHGAKDPELLADCKSGSHCLSLTDTNFTRYTCWMKVGYCKDLTVADLMPGDVICWYSADNYYGHLSIYAGNNTIIDAQGIKDCWGPDSIAVRKNYADNMLRGAVRHSKKSYVMRYNK